MEKKMETKWIAVKEGEKKMEKKADWKAIVNSNYVADKVTPALKTDGSPYLGKAQMYLESGVWCDKYHAKMENLEIDETTKRQVPKSRAGYSTLYKVKSDIPAIKKGGLKDILQQLQNYTGRKGAGKTDAAKAESLLRAIKKDLNKGEKSALNGYLYNFYKVVVADGEHATLDEVTKAVKIGYGIMTAEAKGGKK